MLTNMFVIFHLSIESFAAHIARQKIDTSVYRHVVISTMLTVESFCTHGAPVHNTRVLIPVILVVCSVTETFLTLVTVKLESSCMEDIHMTSQISFVAEPLVTFDANKGSLQLHVFFKELLLFLIDVVIRFIQGCARLS